MPKKIEEMPLSEFLKENGVSPEPSDAYLLSDGHIGLFQIFARVEKDEQPTHSVWAPYSVGQNVLTFIPFGFRGETYHVDDVVFIATASTSVRKHELRLKPAAFVNGAKRAGVLETLATHFELNTRQDVTIFYPKGFLSKEEDK